MLSKLVFLPILALLAACTSTDPDPAPAADASAATPDATSDPTVRILPLGDSLTLGFGSATEGTATEGGYRVRLAQRLRDDAIAFDFVGSQSNGPATLEDRDHEGYNGFAVAQVGDIATSAVATYEPDVILLMAGTNDQITFVPPSQPPAGAAADLEALITQLDRARPGVHIIVAQVIPLTHNDEGIVAYNALLPDIVTRQQANGIRVRLVDMYAIGTEMLSTDGIHPTLAGYDAIADIWYAALRDTLADI